MLLVLLALAMFALCVKLLVFGLALVVACMLVMIGLVLVVLGLDLLLLTGPCLCCNDVAYSGGGVLLCA